MLGSSELPDHASETLLVISAIRKFWSGPPALAGEWLAPGPRRAVHSSPPAVTAPQAMNPVPTIQSRRQRTGAIFSANTRKVKRAIHRRFMVPTTNSTAISAQQQPTQFEPLRIPTTRAPTAPSRHSFTRKASGERHLVMQAFFMGLNWNRPTATSMAALIAAEVLSPIAETSAARDNPHCAVAAGTQ